MSPSSLEEGCGDSNGSKSRQSDRGLIPDQDGNSDKHDARDPTTSPPSETLTLRQKWLTVSTGCLICFVAGINSTAILAGVQEISEEFDIDLETFDYSVFLITAWNFSAALAPLFVLPLMEDFGISVLFYPIYIMFVLFVMVQAVAHNFATLIVARVIAGACGGVLQNFVDGMSTDCWGEDLHNRALSITFYIFTLVGGVSVGPAIGGAVIKSLSWRWISYVQLIICGGLLPYIAVTLKDTRAHAAAESKGAKKEKLKGAFRETIFRAIHMLFTEFTVAIFALFSSFSFGNVLILTQSVPQVYSTIYNWSEWQTGVVEISLFLGVLVGAALCAFQDRVIYPRYMYHGARSSQAVPEPRLYTVVPCSLLGLTAGFFIYGWTAYASISWVLPSLGLFLIGLGIMTVIQAITTYVTDCYPSHASSAASAIAFGENTFAAFLPLATRDMYNTLGFHWASSLLGFVALALSMAPIILIFKGPSIRARSKFTG